MKLISSITGSSWGAAEPASAQPVALPWDALRLLNLGAGLAWQKALDQDKSQALPWEESAAQDLAARIPHKPAATQPAHHAALPWNALRLVDVARLVLWDKTISPRDVALRLIYNPKPRWVDRENALSVWRTDELSPRRTAAQIAREGLYAPSSSLAFSFAGRAYFPSTAPAVFFDFRYVPPIRRSQPVDSASRVRWDDARRLDSARRIPWGRARLADGALTGITYPDYDGPVKPLPEPPKKPEILDTYMIANQVTALALPSHTPLQLQNVRLALDADSFAWALSAEVLTKAGLDLIRPDGTGGKLLELTINGHVWEFVVERYSQSRKFPEQRWQINGASKTQLLAEPYAPKRSAVNAAPINAAQVVDAQLEYTGFTASWGATDWTFPANTCAYQNLTAMQVITRLAETVGAIVRPSMTDTALSVIDRYPAPPWEWSDVSAPISKIIPLAMMTDMSGEWTPQPAYNACYTSGTVVGCSMLVRREGTAGDLPTPDVIDDWLTDQPANQARGTEQLAASGNIELVGITLPLFPADDDHGVGLIVPGELCKVPDDAGAWVGLCLSVEISAAGTGAQTVMQTIKLERNHTWQP